MAAMEQARFTLRIHPLVMEKMKYIAESNGRSVNKEIEQILKWVIDDYENRRGASMWMSRISPVFAAPGRIKNNCANWKNRPNCATAPSVPRFLN